jgi:hypothetical protein
MEAGDELDPRSFIEQILFSTLRIELLNDSGELQGIGTGFLVKVDFPQNQSESLVLLVSNRHVLTGSDRFNITFHRKKTNSDLPELGQTLSLHTDNFKEALFLHPNFKIDLACVNISGVISKLGTNILQVSRENSICKFYRTRA